VAAVEAAALRIPCIESRCFFPSLSSQQDFVLEGRGGVKGARFLRGEANP